MNTQTTPTLIEFPARSGSQWCLTNIGLGAEQKAANPHIVAKLTGPHLVDLHNRLTEYVGGQLTRRFSDLSAGQRRVWAQLQAYQQDQDARREAEEASLRREYAALTDDRVRERLSWGERNAPDSLEVRVAREEAAKRPPLPASPVAKARAAAQAHLGTTPAPAKAPRPPKKARPALKQDDGTYVFDMAPRPAGRFKTIGGRRPELMAFLREGHTFPELVKWYGPRGDDYDTRAFNMATAVTCMCHTVGCGVRTEGDGATGRITFSEAL